MDVARMTGDQTDEVARAYARRNNEHLISVHRERLLADAQANGVPLVTAAKTLSKINGHYMLPSRTRTPSPSPPTGPPGSSVP